MNLMDVLGKAGGRIFHLTFQRAPMRPLGAFFAIHDTQKAALLDENALLKRRVDTLESQLRVVEFELRCTQSALGPWFRNSGSTSLSPPSSQLPTHSQPTSASTSRPRTDLSYFPELPLDDRFELPLSYQVASEQIWPQPPPERPEFPSLSNRASMNGIPTQNWPNLSYPPTVTRSHQTVIAPLNLNTTLEGSLEGLRESIVGLSTSLDSLGRRSDIALTNETLRLNEEVMSLKATLHGLRMQVHTIMMDRNAQVTGRAPGIDSLFMQADSSWRMQNAPSNSITKL